MTFPAPPFRVSSAHVWLNRAWLECDEKPGWNLLLVLQDGSIQHHFIHHLSGAGSLCGKSIHNPRTGRDTITVTAYDSIISIDRTTASIIAEHEYGKERRAHVDGTDILLRLNTDCLKPGQAHLPRWRVVTNITNDSYTEVHVMDFKLTGRWVGARHDFSDHGPKMNIRCTGTVEVDNGTAYIMA